MSTIQLDGLGREFPLPIKSSLHVREKPGMEGGAAWRRGRKADKTATSLRVDILDLLGFH